MALSLPFPSLMLKLPINLSSAVGDQDGLKVLTSVNFPITLIVSLLFVAVLLLSCLFLWLKKSVIVPESNASSSKKMKNLKCK